MIACGTTISTDLAVNCGFTFYCSGLIFTLFADHRTTNFKNLQYKSLSNVPKNATECST